MQLTQHAEALDAVTNLANYEAERVQSLLKQFKELIDEYNPCLGYTKTVMDWTSSLAHIAEEIIDEMEEFEDHLTTGQVERDEDDRVRRSKYEK